jgi:guanylate kinase
VSLGVVMYGPPAAGKDTVTAMLAGKDPRYRQFRRIKVGQGRTEGYRMATPNDVARLEQAGDILWANHRYNANYYVDRPFLTKELAEGWPVLHLGQAAAISAVRNAFRTTQWLVSYLWCPREVAEQRVTARATGDTTERMAAWDETEPISDALFIDTSVTSPDEAATLIDSAVRRTLARA